MNPVVVLRAVSGLRLVLFPEDEVRAALPGDRDPEDLSPAELAELRMGATPLTVTETLFELDGERWLMQQTGPAWADPAEAAADLCGLLFTRIDGSQRRYAVTGRPPGPPPPDDELRTILRAALAGEA